MKKKQPKSHTRSLSKRLAELQRVEPFEISDHQNLRQPYMSADNSSFQDYTVETFTTYGAYQDPV